MAPWVAEACDGQLWVASNGESDKVCVQTIYAKVK